MANNELVSMTPTAQSALTATSVQRFTIQDLRQAWLVAPMALLAQREAEEAKEAREAREAEEAEEAEEPGESLPLEAVITALDHEFLRQQEGQRLLGRQRRSDGRMTRAVRDGERGGWLPYGYQRTQPGSPTSTIVIVPARGVAVQVIFALRAQGLSLRAIAYELSHRQIPTRRGVATWSASSVREILRHESMYRGGRRGPSEALWPIILDDRPASGQSRESPVSPLTPHSDAAQGRPDGPSPTQTQNALPPLSSQTVHGRPKAVTVPPAQPMTSSPFPAYQALEQPFHTIDQPVDGEPSVQAPDGPVATVHSERREEAFCALAQTIQACRICLRMEGRSRVFSKQNGNPQSNVLMIAEAPGRLGADRSQIPLSGDQTGRNFERLIQAAGITRQQLFITNAVLCNPRDVTGKNAPPSEEEVRNCSRHLSQTVKLVQPRYVVTLGRAALHAVSLLAPHDVQLAKDVASVIPWNGRLLIPLYHPGPRACIHRPLSQQMEDYRLLASLLTVENG